MNHRLLTGALLLACSAAPVSSYAAIEVRAECSVAGGFSLSVENDTGSTGHAGAYATLYDSSGSVVAYYDGIAARYDSSVGRFHFYDSASNGGNFDLAGPSTNKANSIVHVKLTSGRNAGTTIQDENAVCPVFGNPR